MHLLDTDASTTAATASERSSAVGVAPCHCPPARSLQKRALGARTLRVGVGLGIRRVHIRLVGPLRRSCVLLALQRLPAGEGSVEGRVDEAQGLVLGLGGCFARRGGCQFIALGNLRGGGVGSVKAEGEGRARGAVRGQYAWVRPVLCLSVVRVHHACRVQQPRQRSRRNTASAPAT